MRRHNSVFIMMNLNNKSVLNVYYSEKNTSNNIIHCRINGGIISKYVKHEQVYQFNKAYYFVL